MPARERPRWHLSKPGRRKLDQAFPRINTLPAQIPLCPSPLTPRSRECLLPGFPREAYRPVMFPRRLNGPAGGRATILGDNSAMKYLVLGTALFLGACTTQGDMGQTRDRAANEGSVAGVNERGERVRCEYIRNTGTRFRTRVCRTEAEWSRLEENARQIAEDSQNRTAPDPVDPETGIVSINPRDR